MREEDAAFSLLPIQRMGRLGSRTKREVEEERGSERVNGDAFDPGRQMLRSLFCVEAHLSWQEAISRWLFVPNPALMRQIEARKRRGGATRRGKRFGGGMTGC